MAPCACCTGGDAGSLCSGCRSVSYCNAACQHAHWAAHKAICKAIKADAAQGVSRMGSNCDSCDAVLPHVDLRCTFCWSVSYCNAACQLAHWTLEHRSVCKAVGEAKFARFMAKTQTGDRSMMYNIGQLYTSGVGVPIDLHAAFKWYRRAANAGHVVSQNNLAQCFMHGNGVPINLAEALKWHRRSAEAGNPQAQYNVASNYMFGIVVTKDLRVAFKWCLRAAEAKHLKAMDSVGTFYMNGTGVARDLHEARLWYERAAAAGSADALARLARLDSGDAKARGE